MMNERYESEQDQHWEQAAFRWVLGLGVLLGAWWTLFGMLALAALAIGSHGGVLLALMLGFGPNLVWQAAKHGDRVAVCLGWLEAAWRIGRVRRTARRPSAASP
jgi:uncharacterized membrane protein